jgi:hypothetical protein
MTSPNGIGLSLQATSGRNMARPLPIVHLIFLALSTDPHATLPRRSTAVIKLGNSSHISTRSVLVYSMEFSLTNTGAISANWSRPSESFTSPRLAVINYVRPMQMPLLSSRSLSFCTTNGKWSASTFVGHPFTLYSTSVLRHLVSDPLYAIPNGLWNEPLVTLEKRSNNSSKPFANLSQRCNGECGLDPKWN